jgi:hypothetical protein
MKENHIAYKITKDTSGLVCTHSEFEEDKMVDLLKDVKRSKYQGIYWIFKQLKGKPQEALCIIDGGYNRIYYHHSGDVEDIDAVIKKLS